MINMGYWTKPFKRRKTKLLIHSFTFGNQQINRMAVDTMSGYIGPAFGWNALIIAYLFRPGHRPPSEVTVACAFNTFVLYLGIWRFFFLKVQSLIFFTIGGIVIIYLSRKFAYNQKNTLSKK